MARICVIRQEQALLDPRVVREVEALVGAGHSIDLICERGPEETWREERGTLTVRRLPSLPRGSMLAYALRYAAFLLAAGTLVGLLHLRRRYDLVQVNSLPDALVFAALIPRLSGTPVLLDLHECAPEFFAVRSGYGFRHPVVRVVAMLEQLSIRFATRATTCTEPMREAFLRRGAPPRKVTVVHNGPDETVFDPRHVEPIKRDPHAFVLFSHGLIDQRHGLETIVGALQLLADDLPRLQLVIHGAGPDLSKLEELTAALGLTDRVTFNRGWVSFEELARHVAAADVGIVATRRDPLGDLTHCNKMYEFMVMKKPVVASRTTAVEAYFGDGCFEMFSPGNEQDLARAIRALHDDPDRCRELARRALAAMEPYRWPRQRNVYLGLVEQLLGGDSE